MTNCTSCRMISQFSHFMQEFSTNISYIPSADGYYEFSNPIVFFYIDFFSLFRSCERPPYMAISGRLANRPTNLDKIKNPDLWTVGILYRRGDHWGRWVRQGRHMLQTNKETTSWAAELCHTILLIYMGSHDVLHGFHVYLFGCGAILLPLKFLVCL